jgi:dihydroorotase
MGTTGLETAFAALYTELVMSGSLDLNTVVARMTAGGELYGLPAPRIAVGQAANVCLVDLESRFQVGEDGYVSRSGNSCFHGRSLHGRVVTTLAGGQIAYRRPMLVARSVAPASGTSRGHTGA